MHDSDNETSPQISFNVSGVVVGIIACMIVGVLFGICWLQIMKRFANTIIKGMLFLNIGIWVVVAIIGVMIGVLALTVIGIILAAVYSLYAWYVCLSRICAHLRIINESTHHRCIWSRIPFASALLSISSTIINKYQGTIFISLAVIVFNILWILLWGSCAAAYILVSTKGIFIILSITAIDQKR